MDIDIDSTINLRTGRTMPAIGLGTWKLTDDTVGTVSYALELGYRLIDTSSDYGSQQGIGEAINSSGIDRNEIFLAAKVEETDDAYEATKKYLDEMQQEYADLMLIHRPPDEGAGEELWRGLMKAKEEGLAVDIGVSNYPMDLIQQLIDKTGEVPVVNQIEWTPFGFSEAMLQYCIDNEIIIQAYSPLTRASRLEDDRLEQLSAKYAKTPAQIILRWNLQAGAVPLPKANKREHLEENIDVFDFELSIDDMALLSEFNEEYSSLGGLSYI